MFCFLSLSFFSCTSTIGGYEYNLVTKDRTPFYTQGPGEEVPDSYLEKGTRLKLLGSTGEGFVRVETTRGKKGFVPTSYLEKQDTYYGTPSSTLAPSW
ncbi:SH3 domain-containing protein [Methylacidiphilum caldifontis]|nr:SH3 domain-containing protein [Methylacidiphilum caldifontis]